VGILREIAASEQWLVASVMQTEMSDCAAGMPAGVGSAGPEAGYTEENSTEFIDCI
jgi:hypothetical protein